MRGALRRFLIWAVCVAAAAGCANVVAPKGTTLVDITASRTFEAPVEQVAAAAGDAIKQMGFTEATTLPEEKGKTIEAVAGDRTVHIRLDPSSDKSTKVGVSVLRNGRESLADDANQVIERTGQSLAGHNPTGQGAGDPGHGSGNPAAR